MMIYIRHAEDETMEFRHDEELSRSGKREARKKAYQLLETYGVPDYIYYSPFQRTRATKKEMVKAIKDYKKRQGIQKRVELVIDPALGRYFNPKERQNPEVHPETLKRGALTDETKKVFKQRVYQQMSQNIGKGIVWNITHTLVLIRAAKISKIDYPKHVEYLEDIIISSTEFLENSQSFS